jgi:anti-anti-sigma factor
MIMTGTHSPGTPARPEAARDRAPARPPLLRARLAQTGGQKVLSLAGELDLTNAGVVRDAAAECLQERPACLAIDLRAVTFCDCSGVRALRWALRQAAAADVAFRLIAPRPQVRRVLALLAASDLLDAAEAHASDPAPSAPGRRTSSTWSWPITAGSAA